jgi:hypothetical protein
MGAGASASKKPTSATEVIETESNWLIAQVPECVAAPASARIKASIARPSDAGHARTAHHHLRLTGRVRTEISACGRHQPFCGGSSAMAQNQQHAEPCTARNRNIHGREHRVLRASAQPPRSHLRAPGRLLRGLRPPHMRPPQYPHAHFLHLNPSSCSRT